MVSGKEQNNVVNLEPHAPMCEGAGRPAAIPFFVERLVNAAAAPKMRPRVGLLCSMVPAEIAMAAGADVVRLDCGSGSSIEAGSSVLCGEACPLAKATIGAFEKEDAVQASCDAFIIPATCDSKRQLAKVLDTLGPTFHFIMPDERDTAEGAAAIESEMVRLGEFLGKLTGQAPTVATFKGAFAKTQRRSEIVSGLVEARMRQSGCLSIRDLFVCVQSSLFSPEPIDTWLEQAERLLKEVENSEGDGKRRRRRLILTGSPVIWPNFKPLNIIEDCGALVIADTLCSGAQACIQESGSGARLSTLADYYRELAVRMSGNPLCPCSSSPEARMRHIIDLAQRGRADGVVQYSMHSCHPVDVESAKLGRVLRDRRVPFLNLRTGYDLDDAQDLRIQVEMFLESI